MTAGSPSKAGEPGWGRDEIFFFWGTQLETVAGMQHCEKNQQLTSKGQRRAGYLCLRTRSNQQDGGRAFSRLRTGGLEDKWSINY